jgi:hypothetical protein
MNELTHWQLQPNWYPGITGGRTLITVFTVVAIVTWVSLITVVKVLAVVTVVTVETVVTYYFIVPCIKFQ